VLNSAILGLGQLAKLDLLDGSFTKSDIFDRREY
jgi:hypothetical protein